MGIRVRHVVWTSAALALGSFIYVVTLEPMDEDRFPRAAAIGQGRNLNGMIDRVRGAMIADQHDSAIEQAHELVGYYPSEVRALYHLAIAYRGDGRESDAARIWEQILDLIEKRGGSIGTSPNLYYYAWAIHEIGDRDTGQQLFGQVADQYAQASKDGDDRWGGFGAIDHYNLACYRSMAGELDRAMGHWAFAIELGYGRDRGGRWWMADPDLEPLHDRVRFWELGTRIDATDREERSIEPDPESGESDAGEG